MAYTSSYDTLGRTSSGSTGRARTSLLVTILERGYALYVTYGMWVRRLKFRRDLQRLAKAGPHLLKDIGLDRHAGESEAAKPFWRT